MNKTQLIKECIKLRDSYEIKTPLNEYDKNWLIEEVFKYHPNWYDKGDKSIKDIIVNYNWSHYNTKCFYIIYEDNSYDDISFRWCIQHKPNNKN